MQKCALESVRSGGCLLGTKFDVAPMGPGLAPCLLSRGVWSAREGSAIMMWAGVNQRQLPGSVRDVQKTARGIPDPKELRCLTVASAFAVA